MRWKAPLWISSTDYHVARVLTTAKVLRGRMLFVDSKFDEAVAEGPYEVVTGPLAP